MRASALPGREALVAVGIVHDGDDRLMAIDKGDGHTKHGQAMNEVGRAIERVHHPAESGVVRSPSRAFLRQKAGLRKQGLQPFDQPGFRVLSTWLTRNSSP